MQFDASSSSAAGVSMSRTAEVLWDGAASLPFVLKRKRNGAILVTKLKLRAPPTDVRLGSELKLVGGFPVTQLTLAEVKKVMVHAPKPVSLVFLHHDDVVLDNMSFLSEERGSFENEFQYDDLQRASASTRSLDGMAYPPLPESSEWPDDATAWQPHTDSALYRHPRAFSLDDARDCYTSRGGSYASTSRTTDSSGSRRRRRSPSSASSSSSGHPQKVSRLKLALDRMNELLNRPVRRSGLNVSAGKSIVV